MSLTPVSKRLMDCQVSGNNGEHGDQRPEQPCVAWVSADERCHRPEYEPDSELDPHPQRPIGSVADSESGQKTKAADQRDKQANAVRHGNPFPS